MEVILNGIIYGLLLSFLIGPVFFTIIQTSVERGFKCGVLVATGVAISDSFYITVAFLGISQITANDNIKVYLANAGGIMLILFGLYNLVIKSKKLMMPEPEHIKERSPWRYIAKGFIINGLTPVVLLFWLTTVTIAASKFGYRTFGPAILFFGAIISTVLTTDILKAKLADKLRHLLTTKFIQRLNILMGVLLILFGSRLLFFGDKLF
jgi:threonine/homoserine/homoserine lactone efflux protein